MCLHNVRSSLGKQSLYLQKSSTLLLHRTQSEIHQYGLGLTCIHHRQNLDKTASLSQRDGSFVVFEGGSKERRSLLDTQERKRQWFQPRTFHQLSPLATPSQAAFSVSGIRIGTRKCSYGDAELDVMFSTKPKTSGWVMHIASSTTLCFWYLGFTHPEKPHSPARVKGISGRGEKNRTASSNARTQWEW